MKRVLSVFLILGMIIAGLVPAAALAAEQYQVPAGFPKGFNSPIDETRSVPLGGFGGGSGIIAHNPVFLCTGIPVTRMTGFPSTSIFLARVIHLMNCGH